MYALSFFSPAPAVCPLMTQPLSSINESVFIVVESLLVTFVQEKTSPSPITLSSFVADFISERLINLLELNFGSTGRPPGIT